METDGSVLLMQKSAIGHSFEIHPHDLFHYNLHLMLLPICQYLALQVVPF
jgi:hypothetical protein